MPVCKQLSELLRLEGMAVDDPSALEAARSLVKTSHPDRFQHPDANKIFCRAHSRFLLIRQSAQKMPELKNQTENFEFAVFVSEKTAHVVPFEIAAARRRRLLREKENNIVSAKTIDVPRYFSAPLFVYDEEQDLKIPVVGSIATVPLSAENGEIIQVRCFDEKNHRQRDRMRTVKVKVFRV